MGRFFLGLLGIAASILLIRFRRVIGDMLVETEWTQKIGGIHMIVIYAAIFIFLWSLLWMFNLLDVIIAPLVAPFTRMSIG